MANNLKFKIAAIVVVILVCVYGIIGIPKSTDELVANWKKNIHLGLDLKGGTQLVLQVQIQDAFKSEADSVIQRMRDELTKAKVGFGEMMRNDPNSLQTADQIQIDVKGVPATQAGNFRQVINDNFGGVWNQTQVNQTDFRLTMKPSEALKLRQDTLTQSMHTIEKKINALGLAESSVQQRGGSNADAESQLLVQLPGVDDPARVKQILKTAAMLELYSVLGGPYASREEALSQKGGVLPLNSQLLSSQAKGGAPGETYLLARTPVVTGRDLRDASPAQGEGGQWETNFVLTQDAAKRFEAFTGANIGQRLAIVLDKVVISAPTIQSKISDTGRITGASSHDEAGRPGAEPARGIAAGGRGISGRAHRRTVAGIGFDPLRHRGGRRGRDCRDRGDADLLQAQRHQRDAGADPERRYSDRGTELLRCGADSAGHRGRDPDDRYGGGLQRSDFRAHPRGVARGQGRDRGRGCRV